MDDSQLEQTEWWPLESQQAVYRAYRNDSDAVSTGYPKAKVFYRRKAPNDTDGLSVGLTRQAAVRNLDARGLCELVVGEVRRILPLDVVQDSEDHGNIINVPRREEDEETALRIANDLARIAKPTSVP